MLLKGSIRTADAHLFDVSHGLARVIVDSDPRLL